MAEHPGCPRARLSRRHGPQPRDANQDAFLKEEDLCLVATVAFGMGIDKPNVRYVAHLDLPGSVEAYYQETGRAGRDGLPSDVWMAYGMADVIQRGRMIDGGTSGDDIKRVERAKLNALLAICETPGCRRQAILAHFGEAHAAAAAIAIPASNRSKPGTEPMLPSRRWRRSTAPANASAPATSSTCCSATRMKRPPASAMLSMPVFGAGKDIPSKTWQSVYRQLLAAGLSASITKPLVR
jgi:ATP-dependent DNA helicase RecQ